MEVKLKPITVRMLTNRYEDRGEDGVFGFNGKLDVRPPYQREFVYGSEKRNAVIDSVLKGYPLNVMYWAVLGRGRFEIIDGQQRTISICKYVANDFSYKGLAFHNQPADKQKKILNYRLFIYRCTGTDSEKLKWFEIVNMNGVRLYPQEIRNAVYSGPWVHDARAYFSKTGCNAQKIASNYIRGSPLHQDYLEAAIKWVSNDRIKDYMSKNQHKKDAKPMWNHFKKVVRWVKTTFPDTKPEMKNVDWGFLYRQYSKKQLNPDKLEKEIIKLLDNDDVTNKHGVYQYVLTRDEKHLHIRGFKNSTKLKVYRRQKKKCVMCGKKTEFADMQADHKKPWSKGGKTVEANCQMLCASCHNKKTTSQRSAMSLQNSNS